MNVLEFPCIQGADAVMEEYGVGILETLAATLHATQFPQTCEQVWISQQFVGALAMQCSQFENAVVLSLGSVCADQPVQWMHPHKRQNF